VSCASGQHSTCYFHRHVGQSVNLLNIKKECSNVMPLHDYLQPRDKSTLCHVGATCVFFDLDTAAFGSGNIFNTEDAMDKLKKDICPHMDTPHLELRASPCSFVTLSDLDRLTVCACCVCVHVCLLACTFQVYVIVPSLSIPGCHNLCND